VGERREQDVALPTAATSLARGSAVDPTSATPDAARVVPAPVEFSETIPIAVGTAIWVLLFVIGLFVRSDLAENGREWWLWSAAAGAVLGVLGYFIVRRRQARLLARAASVDDPGGDPRTPDRS
jgi:hypothetical protein